MDNISLFWNKNYVINTLSSANNIKNQQGLKLTAYYNFSYLKIPTFILTLIFKF